MRAPKLKAPCKGKHKSALPPKLHKRHWAASAFVLCKSAFVLCKAEFASSEISLHELIRKGYGIRVGEEFRQLENFMLTKTSALLPQYLLSLKSGKTCKKPSLRKCCETLWLLQQIHTWGKVRFRTNLIPIKAYERWDLANSAHHFLLLRNPIWQPDELEMVCKEISSWF